jgi:hypothetical protein
MLKETLWLRYVDIILMPLSYGRGLQEGRNFDFKMCFQTVSGAHPASYPVGTGGSVPSDKPAGV